MSPAIQNHLDWRVEVLADVDGQSSVYVAGHFAFVRCVVEN